MDVREREAGDLDRLKRLARRGKVALRRNRWRAVLLAIEGVEAPATARMFKRARLRSICRREYLTREDQG
jgi:hypothetical protein